MNTITRTVTVNGCSVNYRELVESFPYEFYQENEIRFLRALRKASGFQGRGLITRGDVYGRSIGNSTMSCYGKFELSKEGI